MDNFGKHIIDGQHKIALSKELLETKKLYERSTIKLFATNKSLFLTTSDKQKLTIATVDDMGKIAISKELMNQMGWEEGYEISIYYVDDDMVALGSF
ncbi:MAG: hypothetical protein FWE33_03755 [Defluviitaleaceae bacterium]|nr:hypothetical protein [Defluviitaleaceae bacterium]